MKKKIYSVVRTYTESEYLEVEATSEEEAIKLAEEADESEWESNPNDEYLDPYSYVAELVED